MYSLYMNWSSCAVNRVKAKVSLTAGYLGLLLLVSQQLVYGHFVYGTSSSEISPTDISSTITFFTKIEAGVMKRILYQ